jgi:hypothetical protein
MTYNPSTVSRAELLDRKDFSGIAMSPDGSISIYANGKGMRCGPLPAHDLERYGLEALRIVENMRSAARYARATAAAELDALVAGGGDAS